MVSKRGRGSDEFSCHARYFAHSRGSGAATSTMANHLRCTETASEI